MAGYAGIRSSWLRCKVLYKPQRQIWSAFAFGSSAGGTIVDDLVSVASALTAVTDAGLDFVLNTGGIVNSFGGVGIEGVTNTGSGSHSMGEVGIDAFTNTAAGAETLTDLVAYIDALTSSASEIHSLAEGTLDAITSTGTQAGSFGDHVADALAQVASQAGSVAEAAQEGVQSLAVASLDMAEVATDLLTILTSAQNVATVGEVEFDALTNISTLASALAELASDVLVMANIQIGSLEDGDWPMLDMFTSLASFSNTLDDLVINEPPPVVPPAPQPGYVTVGLHPGRTAIGVDKIEAQAEKLLRTGSLPKSYPVGAHKAWNNMQDFYGDADGKRIFIKKAIERGQGDNLRDIIADVYKTGATVGEKKVDTHVQVRGPKPIVRIIIR